MGQTASSVGRALGQPLSWLKGGSTTNSTGGGDTQLDDGGLVPRGVKPFIWKRRGSMFFDEDGDLAHEFYCEVVDRASNKVVMRRSFKNLRPQGEVELPYPRINGDVPIILFDASSVQYYSQS